MALADIDDHARIGVFAERNPGFSFRISASTYQAWFRQFGGGFFNWGMSAVTRSKGIAKHRV
jgi:hypothetical protein